MARVLTDGAELGYNVIFDIGGDVSIRTDVVRTGLYSYRIGSWLYGNGLMSKYISAGSEYAMRFAFRLDRVTWDSGNIFFGFRNTGSNMGFIQFNKTSGVYEAYVGATLVGTGTSVIQADTWYLCEIYYKMDDSAGILAFKIDGVVQVNYTGDTKPSTNTTFNQVFFHNTCEIGGGTATYLFVDDIAVNDTSGVEDNGWCGDGRVLFIRPNAAGDVTQLTPSTGSNYACVDEVPHNSDTDYVYGDGIDDYDLYNLSTLSLTDDDKIMRVQPIAIAKNVIASGGKLAIGLKTDGVEHWGDDQILTIGYLPYFGDEHTINPETSTFWSIDDINALQVGAKVRGV